MFIKSIKRISKYVLVFLCTVAILLGLLVGVAMIPRSVIEENVQKSAEFLCEGELFCEVIEGISGSKVDRYADSILLGIAYQYEEKEPLTSVMWSSYYHARFQNENENLHDAVTKNLPANQQYLRYWHGSNVIVRPLLLVFSLEQIYVCNAIVVAILLLLLLGLFVKQKAWILVGGFVAGTVLTNTWVVPFSLEYTWTYMLMCVMAIICWQFALQRKYEQLDATFLVAGVLTNYFDFLTTETLTILIPLLLVVWVDFNRNRCRSIGVVIKDSIKWMVLWGFGYIGMWFMKWCIASVVLQQNVMPYVTEHIVERTMGDVGLSWWQCVKSMMERNITCLFPMEYGEIGSFAGVFTVTVLCCLGYVYHKKKMLSEHVFLYMLIAVVPFVRYVVLLNHSYIHYFFTYRALFATILSCVLILDEVVEWRRMIRGNARKRKS